MPKSAQSQSLDQAKPFQDTSLAAVTHHQIFRFLIGKVLGKLGAFADDFVADVCNAGHIYVFARDGNNESVDDVLRKERIVLRKYGLFSYGIFKTNTKGARFEDRVRMPALGDLQKNKELCDCVLPTEQDFGPVQEAILAEKRVEKSDWIARWGPVLHSPLRRRTVKATGSQWLCGSPKRDKSYTP